MDVVSAATMAHRCGYPPPAEQHRWPMGVALPDGAGPAGLELIFRLSAKAQRCPSAGAITPAEGQRWACRPPLTRPPSGRATPVAHRCGSPRGSARFAAAGGQTGPPRRPKTGARNQFIGRSTAAGPVPRPLRGHFAVVFANPKCPRSQAPIAFTHANRRSNASNCGKCPECRVVRVAGPGQSQDRARTPARPSHVADLQLAFE